MSQNTINNSPVHNRNSVEAEQATREVQALADNQQADNNALDMKTAIEVGQQIIAQLTGGQGGENGEAELDPQTAELVAQLESILKRAEGKIEG